VHRRPHGTPPSSDSGAAARALSKATCRARTDRAARTCSSSKRCVIQGRTLFCLD
jgi:hypothetical protein